jgi:hypothetical protein
MMKPQRSLVFVAALMFSTIACDDDDDTNVVINDASRDTTSGNPAPAPDAGAVADTRQGDTIVPTGVASPTFTQVYTTVIAVRCMPCHTTPTGIGVTMGLLDMTSAAAAYTNLVNKPAAGAACSGRGTRVVAGMPDMSIMFLKVSLDDPAPCGAKMPLGGALTRTEADLIENWILGGASNN